MQASVIYADERIVVMNKPAGISMVTHKAEPHAAAARLLASVPAETRIASGLDSGPLLLVHRLDVATTGAVLLARDEETHALLSRLLSQRLIRKTYLALVWGHPRPPAGVFEQPLSPDRRDRRRMRADVQGKPAITRYQILAKARHVSLLELHPETGRTHQIRVHLADSGHSIVGDNLYAGARHRGIKDAFVSEALNPAHLLLHACRIELPESAGFLPSCFEAPLPLEFQASLAALNIAAAVNPG